MSFCEAQAHPRLEVRGLMAAPAQIVTNPRPQSRIQTHQVLMYLRSWSVHGASVGSRRLNVDQSGSDAAGSKLGVSSRCWTEGCSIGEFIVLSETQEMVGLDLDWTWTRTWPWTVCAAEPSHVLTEESAPFILNVNQLGWTSRTRKMLSAVSQQETGNQETLTESWSLPESSRHAALALALWHAANHWIKTTSCTTPTLSTCGLMGTVVRALADAASCSISRVEHISSDHDVKHTISNCVPANHISRFHQCQHVFFLRMCRLSSHVSARCKRCLISQSYRPLARGTSYTIFMFLYKEEVLTSTAAQEVSMKNLFWTTDLNLTFTFSPRLFTKWLLMICGTI